MTTIAPDVTDPAIETPAPVTVCALVVSESTDVGLRPLLQALAAQSRAPERIVLINRTGADLTPDLLGDFDARFQESVQIRDVEPRRLLREVVAAVAREEELRDDDLLWVLPAGAVPTFGALAQLLGAHRRSERVGIAAPKLLDASDPTVLRSAGVQVTRTGRVVPLPRDGTPDMRQFDDRRDALAVPLVGALLGVGVIRELRGWDRSLGDLGGDVDFGWRTQLSGRRVELVPSAQVRVARGLGNTEADSGPRRRAIRRVAAIRASWWAAPFLALWVALGALASGVALLLLKRPRQAFVEWADLAVLDPFRWGVSKYRTRGRPRVKRRHLARLFVPAAAVRQQISDGAAALVLPTRQEQDTDAEREESSTLVRIVSHPGVLSAVAAAVAVAAAGRTFGAGIFGSLSAGLVGGEFTGGRVDAGSLWSSWTDGWSGGGLGHAGSGSPHLAVLAVLTWLIELVPGGLASPGGAAVAAFVLLSPILAAVSAYLAGRVVTLARWPRAAVALAWVTLDAAGPAYAQGRLGPLVALVLLPAVAAGFATLARRGAGATSAWATALALALLGAFVPALLILSVLLALVLVLTAPSGGAKARALVAALGAMAALGPWWLTVADNWRVLLAGPGLTQWSGPLPTGWQIGALHPGGVGSLPWWSALPVLVLGVLGLLSGRSVRSLASAVAVLGLVSLAAALTAPRIQLADVPPGAGSGSVTPWAGTFILPLTLALLAGALLSARTLAAAKPRRGAALVPAVGGLALAALALVPAVALGVTTLGDGLRAWSEPRPAVAVEQADGPLAGRALFISRTAQGPGYRLVARESDGLSRTLPQTTPPAALSATVSALLAGGSPEQAADPLRANAIGLVAIQKAMGDDVARGLDATKGLTRLAPRGEWYVWRVAPPAGATDAPVGPPRVHVVADGRSTLVPVTGEHSATRAQFTAPEGARLVIAEAPEWSRHARVSLDGRVLAPEASAATSQVSYAVPAGAHDLTIELAETGATARVLQAVLLAAMCFLAIPLGGRARRRL